MLGVFFDDVNDDDNCLKGWQDKNIPLKKKATFDHLPPLTASGESSDG